MSERFPAISLWQPYASLVACGAKLYETRHWPAPDRLIGKRIAIHAAKRKPTRLEYGAMAEDIHEALGEGWRERVPYGAVVCTAVLKECGQVISENPLLVRLDNEHVLNNDYFGDYSMYRYCWRLTDVETFDPVQERGRQGWWTWERPE